VTANDYDAGAKWFGDIYRRRRTTGEFEDDQCDDQRQQCEHLQTRWLGLGWICERHHDWSVHRTDNSASCGIYSILVDLQITYAGNMTLTLYDVVDFSGSTTVNGSSVTVTLNTPGQNGQVTFSGTSGRQVTVRVSSNTESSQAPSTKKPLRV